MIITKQQIEDTFIKELRNHIMYELKITGEKNIQKAMYDLYYFRFDLPPTNKLYLKRKLSTPIKEPKNEL